jgi:hypothetical protein
MHCPAFPVTKSEETRLSNLKKKQAVEFLDQTELSRLKTLLEKKQKEQEKEQPPE